MMFQKKKVCLLFNYLSWVFLFISSRKGKLGFLKYLNFWGNMFALTNPNFSSVLHKSRIICYIERRSLMDRIQIKMEFE